MVQHAFAELAVGREAGVVDVVDVIALQPLVAPVGAAARAASFVVAAVREQFVADVTILYHPHAHKAIRVFEQSRLSGLSLR